MKAYRGGGIAPLILKIDVLWDESLILVPTLVHLTSLRICVKIYIGWFLLKLVDRLNSVLIAQK
jgi:hypothetical protein